MNYISQKDEIQRLFAKIELLIKELYLYQIPDVQPPTNHYFSDEFGYPCGLRKRIISKK
jgi:hypothetical protein